MLEAKCTERCCRKFITQTRFVSTCAYRCDFYGDCAKLKHTGMCWEVYSGICQTLDLAPYLRQQKGNLDILPNQQIIFAVQRLAFFCSRSL